MAQLVERHVPRPVRLVGRDRAQQTGPQRHPQHALLRHQRVGKTQGLGVGHPRARVLGGIEERIGHHLGRAEGEHGPAQRPPPRLQRRESARAGGRRHDPSQSGVPVVARELLDQVDLGGAVGAPRRDRDRQPRPRAPHREADAPERRADRRDPHRGAEDPPDLRGPQRGARGARQVRRARVGRARVHHEPGARLAEDGGEPRDRVVDAHRVDAALEARRGLGAQRHPLTRAADARGREPRRLERDLGRRVGDLAIAAAHHAGDADRHVGAVADEQVVLGARAGRAVEGGHRLAVAREADAESPREPRRVVGVGRLVGLEHHEVGGVHHVVDRPHARVREATLEVRGRRSHHHARHHAHVESRAAPTIDDPHGQGAPRAAPGPIARRRGEPHAQVGREVPRDAQVARGVGAVARDVEVEHDVRPDAECRERVAPRAQARGQDRDAPAVGTETELGGRAEHALGRDAEDLAPRDGPAVGHGRAEGREGHEIARRHVERPAPHVALAVARVDPHALDAVRLRVALRAQHAGDDHARHRCAHVRHVLDREAEGRHRLREALGRARRTRDGAELVEPGAQDLHGAT